jgi:hypothetical protein
MSTAAKDPRINDLFTEGSHHRNLTVIALNQNLYFGKPPPPPPLTPPTPTPPPQVVLQHPFTLMAVVVVVCQSTSFGSERLPSSFGDDFPRYRDC